MDWSWQWCWKERCNRRVKATHWHKVSPIWLLVSLADSVDLVLAMRLELSAMQVFEAQPNSRDFLLEWSSSWSSLRFPFQPLINLCKFGYFLGTWSIWNDCCPDPWNIIENEEKRCWRIWPKIDRHFFLSIFTINLNQFYPPRHPFSNPATLIMLECVVISI